MIIYRHVITAFIMIAAALGEGCGGRSLTDLKGTLLDPPMTVADFTLESAEGPLQLSDFLGKHAVLAFGYTHCPDACPTTMSRLVRTMELLGDDAGRVQVVLVSVDPERDTPALLKSYTQTFDSEFIGANVSLEDAESLFKTFGIYHEHAHGDAADGYLVDHTTSTIVLDPQGRWRLVWNFELQPEEMAADLRKLIRRD